MGRGHIVCAVNGVFARRHWCFCGRGIGVFECRHWCFRSRGIGVFVGRGIGVCRAQCAGASVFFREKIWSHAEKLKNADAWTRWTSKRLKGPVAAISFENAAVRRIQADQSAGARARAAAGQRTYQALLQHAILAGGCLLGQRAVAARRGGAVSADTVDWAEINTVECRCRQTVACSAHAQSRASTFFESLGCVF